MLCFVKHIRLRERTFWGQLRVVAAMKLQLKVFTQLHRRKQRWRGWYVNLNALISCMHAEESTERLCREGVNIGSSKVVNIASFISIRMPLFFCSFRLFPQVSDYVRAIEASKKEAAAFADAVESLTVEHNATMEQLADAHAQMALTAAADALEILEESEASGNRSERGAAAQIVVSEAVKGTAVKPMAMAAGEGEGEASAPAIVVEKKRGTAAAARAMAAEEGEEVARAEPSPEALQLAEHEELRARTAQLTKELETARTETVAVQKALREKTERAESEAKKTKNEMKRLREELHQAQSEKDYTAKVSVDVVDVSMKKSRNDRGVSVLVLSRTLSCAQSMYLWTTQPYITSSLSCTLISFPFFFFTELGFNPRRTRSCQRRCDGARVSGGRAGRRGPSGSRCIGWRLAK